MALGICLTPRDNHSLPTMSLPLSPSWWGRRAPGKREGEREGEKQRASSEHLQSEPSAVQ